MSDSKSWIGTTDHQRVRSLVAESADVVAAARHDLEKHDVDLSPLTGADDSDGPFEPEDDEEAASAHRHAVFRKFLKTRDIDTMRSLEAFDRLGIGDTDADIHGAGKTDTVEEPKRPNRKTKRRKTRFGRRRAVNGLDRSALDRDDPDRAAPWKDARFTHEPWEWRGADPKPNRTRTIFTHWTQRLDSLSNAVAGVLILTLLGFWAMGAGVTVQHAGTKSSSGASAPHSPSVANASVENAPASSAGPVTQAANAGMVRASDTPIDPVAALLANDGVMHAGNTAQKTAFPSTRGFRVLSVSFPKPLPAVAKDIVTMHFWARASVPGITVLPYTGLPQVMPAMPQDIAGHILVTTPQNF